MMSLGTHHCGSGNWGGCGFNVPQKVCGPKQEHAKAAFEAAMAIGSRARSAEAMIVALMGRCGNRVGRCPRGDEQVFMCRKRLVPPSGSPSVQGPRRCAGPSSG